MNVIALVFFLIYTCVLMQYFVAQFLQRNVVILDSHRNYQKFWNRGMQLYQYRMMEIRWKLQYHTKYDFDQIYFSTVAVLNAIFE